MLPSATSVASSSEKSSTSKNKFVVESESVDDPAEKKKSEAVVPPASLSSVKKKSLSKVTNPSTNSLKQNSEQKKQRSSSLVAFSERFRHLKRRNTAATEVLSSGSAPPKRFDKLEKGSIDEEGNTVSSDEAFISAASIVPYRKDLQKSLSTGCVSSCSQYFDVGPTAQSNASVERSESNKSYSCSDTENTPHPVLSLSRIFMEFHLSPALEGETTESISAESIRQAFIANEESTVNLSADIFRQHFPPNKEEWEKEFVERKSIFACCCPKKKKKKRKKHKHSKRRKT